MADPGSRSCGPPDTLAPAREEWAGSPAEPRAGRQPHGWIAPGLPEPGAPAPWQLRLPGQAQPVGAVRHLLALGNRPALAGARSKHRSSGPTGRSAPAATWCRSPASPQPSPRVGQIRHAVEQPVLPPLGSVRLPVEPGRRRCPAVSASPRVAPRGSPRGASAFPPAAGCAARDRPSVPPAIRPSASRNLSGSVRYHLVLTAKLNALKCFDESGRQGSPR